MIFVKIKRHDIGKCAVWYYHRLKVIKWMAWIDGADTRIKNMKKSLSANTNNPCLFREP